MVALVHFSPQRYEGGGGEGGRGRVHLSEAWICTSEDGKHDPDFSAFSHRDC